MARILIVFRPRTGGVFAHVRRLSTELVRRGHEVAVCGPDHGPGDVPGEFEVPRLAAPVPRDFDPLATARAIGAVGAAYRRFRPELIHVHGAQAGVVGRLARVAEPRIPLIHTPHRYPFLDEFDGPVRPAAYRAIERALMPLTTQVLCVCEDERRIAEQLGARGRTAVARNGVEPVERRSEPGSELLEKLGIGSGAERGPLVVAVAELFPRKGVLTLLEASKRLTASHPGLRVVVAGGGPQRDELLRRIDQLGLGGTVLLAGHVADVPALLGTADAFVNPAWFESFPYGVLEAMSIGTPCVATAVGGVPEAIIDGRSGLLVAPRDPEALAAAVGKVLDDPAAAAERARAARERVGERFTRERMFEGTERAYERVLAGTLGRAA